jgi:glycosyltransferase involved in cell wall biosynthesis
LKSRNLIFLTAEFPYGTGETFIENELPFLISAFDKIIIITNKQETKSRRTIPDGNVTVIHYPYGLSVTDKIKSLRGIFSNLFWEEIKIIKTEYQLKIKWSIVKTLLSSIQKKKKTADSISLHIENLSKSNTWVYSYWLNDMAAGMAELKSRMPHLKALSRAHGWDVSMERQPDNYLPLRNFILKNIDVCYTISNHGKFYLNELTHHQYAEKIKLSRLGTINKNSIPKFVLNEQLHLVSCSGLIPLKRIHLIIEGLSSLTIPIKWIHIGNGVLEKDLKNTAQAKLSDKSNIDYQFVGQLSNTEVLDFYSTQQVDIFINVSETEGVPVSIMEAMSFGIPVIATNVGGNSEIVDTINGCLLSSTPSVNEVMEAITLFAKLNKEEYQKYRINARKTWEDKFNATNNYPYFITDLLRL